MKNEHIVKNNAQYTGWVTRVLTPATDIAADNSIDKFHLINYITSQLKANDQQINSCIPNPFAGTTTIDEINQNSEKQIALDTIIQFVHHYARQIVN